mmetsp:Transcript_676/g.1561  ORF Transcript_676/g.1561 Transcript_676/m.1561 type:complete len:248 (+) Transcript_676:218-961(+)
MAFCKALAYPLHRIIVSCPCRNHEMLHRTSSVARYVLDIAEIPPRPLVSSHGGELIIFDGLLRVSFHSLPLVIRARDVVIRPLVPELAGADPQFQRLPRVSRQSHDAVVVVASEHVERLGVAGRHALLAPLDRLLFRKTGSTPAEGTDVGTRRPRDREHAPVAEGLPAAQLVHRRPRGEAEEAYRAILSGRGLLEEGRVQYFGGALPAFPLVLRAVGLLARGVAVFDQLAAVARLEIVADLAAGGAL